MSPIHSLCRRALLPAVLLTLAFGVAHAQRTEPQPESVDVMVAEPVEIAVEAEPDLDSWVAVDTAFAEPEEDHGFGCVTHEKSGTHEEPEYFNVAPPEPLKLTPALGNARMELKARVDAIVCREISPELKKLRGELDDMLKPADRQLLDSVRVFLRPLLKDAFAAYHAVREAKERGDDAAAREHQKRTEQLGEYFVRTLEPLGKVVDDYAEELETIFDRYMQKQAEWNGKFATVAVEWNHTAGVALDERERRYVQQECAKDWHAQVSMMIFLLPFMDSCDFEEPELMIPHGGPALR